MFYYEVCKNIQNSVPVPKFANYFYENFELIFQFHGNAQFFNFLPAQLLSDVVVADKFFE